MLTLTTSITWPRHVWDHSTKRARSWCPPSVPARKKDKGGVSTICDENCPKPSPDVYFVLLVIIYIILSTLSISLIRLEMYSLPINLGSFPKLANHPQHFCSFKFGYPGMCLAFPTWVPLSFVRFTISDLNEAAKSWRKRNRFFFWSTILFQFKTVKKLHNEMIILYCCEKLQKELIQWTKLMMG